MVWADICNEDLLGHRPQHIYRAPRSKARSTDPDIRDKFIQRCLKKYGNEDVIYDFQTLTYFCEKQRDGEECKDEIIFLHEALASKIEKIQLDVDDTWSSSTAHL